MNNNHLKTYATTAIVGIALASMLMLVPTDALAAKQTTSGVHFQGPRPTVTASPTSCSSTGFTLAGLGQGSGTATLTCTATFETECTNPGGNVAPGQDATTTSTAPPQAFSTEKGGKATITAKSIAVQQPTNPDFGCPNDSWTGSVKEGSPTVTATLNVDFNGRTLPGFPITDTFQG